MRTLTATQSATHVEVGVSVTLVPTDQSTTVVFSPQDILGLSGLAWEVPFGGGLGRASNYRLTIGASLGFIKDLLPSLPRAEARLRVDTNGDVFHPHVGRVREIERDALDPNRLTVTVYDTFQDRRQMLPKEAIQDSFSQQGGNPMARVENTQSVDAGYPLYYGRHHRPFYFWPLDDRIWSLIGPRNVSSQNHVNSVFWNPEVERDVTRATLSKSMVLTGLSWAAETGNTNVASSTQPFYVKDYNLGTAGWGRLWEWQGPPTLYAGVGTDTIYTLRDHPGWFEYATGVTPHTRNQMARGIRPLYDVRTVHYLSITTQFSYKSATDSHRMVMGFFVTSADGTPSLKNSQTRNIPDGSNDLVNSFGGAPADFGVGGADNYQILRQDDLSKAVHADVDPDNISVTVFPPTVGRVRLRFEGGLNPVHFRNYSILAFPTNSADVAISENPLAILDDICSHHLSVPYNQTASSDTQVDVDSYAMQCIFDIRRPFNEIMEEFGEITGVYMWSGDSGQVQYRAYTVSADATVNATITTSDARRIRFTENALGLATFTEPRVSRITVRYDYRHQVGRYAKTKRAIPNNNSLCDSAAAANINDDMERTTKYILHDHVASLWLSNLARRFCSTENLAEMDLPAQFFGLEPADVVKVQNPMIVNSETLYQVLRVAPDYLEGIVSVLARELVNETGF